MDDPDDLLLDDDLDVITDSDDGAAIAHGVDINEGVMGHTPPEALLTTGQGTCR